MPETLADKPVADMRVYSETVNVLNSTKDYTHRMKITDEFQNYTFIYLYFPSLFIFRARLQISCNKNVCDKIYYPRQAHKP